MKYPKSRIALCLLLSVLWMRSYYRVDIIRVGQQSVSSLRGKVGVNDHVLVRSSTSVKRDVQIYFNGQLWVLSVDADAVGFRNGGIVIHYAYLLDTLITGMTVLDALLWQIALAAKKLDPTT
jgi:hypothetical protein